MTIYCQEEGCKKQANYNFKGEKQAIYCFTHKKDDMIDVKNRTCNYPDCNTQPFYNYEGSKKGLYCSIHKKDGMINVTNRTCQEDKCKIQPIYNYEGETKGLYCTTHKKEGMIDVTNKRCQEDKCKIQPIYNYEGETKGLYCATHKKDDMIDVTNKRCIYHGCKIQPIYNYEGETKGLYCTTHKKDGMINVKNRTCNYPDCNTQPFYNYEGSKKGLYCAIHKKDGMINVKQILCKSSWCETRSNAKYEGYCLRCFIHLFPDKPNSRNYKTKEKAVADYILEKYPDFSWVTDKTVQDGCSKKRPDLLLDLGYQLIIVEVDENQHQTYDCSCENKRLMELSQDVNHRPIVFIRFNPDDYITKDGKVTSCWGIDGRGICTVKKTKQKEWGERLDILKNQVEYWVNPDNKTEKTVETVQLFYDCN